MELNCSSYNSSAIPSSCQTTLNGPSTERIAAYSVIYGFISLVALIGNGLVCLVIVKNPLMRTVPNAFLLNLAITDIMFIVFTVPGLLALNISQNWPLGDAMCKAVPFLNTVTLSTSIYTMVALAIDRYNAIVHPLQAKVAHTLKRAVIVVTIIWILSAAVAFPQILSQTLIDYYGIIRCEEDWSSLDGILGRRIYGVAIFIIFFAVPITIITVAYTTIIKRLMTTDSLLVETVKLRQERSSSSTAGKSLIDEKKVPISRNNRKTTLMMLTVIVAFLVCMLPLNVMLLIIPFLIDGTYDRETLGEVSSGLIILSVFSSACNPIIYNFFSIKFRKAFADVFRSKCTAHDQDDARHPMQSSFRTKRTSSFL